MKKLLAPITLAILTTACATAGYPMQQIPPMYPGRPMYGPPPMPAVQAGYQLPVLPIGRWDNVMMLAAGTPVQVLLMDGGVATGLVHAADSTSPASRSHQERSSWPPPESCGSIGWPQRTQP